MIVAISKIITRPKRKLEHGIRRADYRSNGFLIPAALYKELGLKDKLPVMSEEEQYTLLASDGMLVKRPILLDGEKILIGFREKEWEELKK